MWSADMRSRGRHPGCTQKFCAFAGPGWPNEVGCNYAYSKGTTTSSVCPRRRINRTPGWCCVLSHFPQTSQPSEKGPVAKFFWEAELTSCSNQSLSFLNLTLPKRQMRIHLAFIFPAASADEDVYGQPSFGWKCRRFSSGAEPTIFEAKRGGWGLTRPVFCGVFRSGKFIYRM
jgi:hypothetical protein